MLAGWKVPPPSDTLPAVTKRTAPEPRESEVTPERLYLRRREFIRGAAAFTATSAVVGGSLVALTQDAAPSDVPAPSPGPPAPSSSAPASPLSTDEAPTPYKDITHYNNFYELGLDKSGPSRHAEALRPRPWSVEIVGEVKRPGPIDLETILGWLPAEERIYRMRCVEAWSMVIPWLGFPLASLIRRLEPTSRAKYVAFTTLLDPTQLPGQKSDVLDWPYVEGLRIDEAMHPLTLLATGIYGRPLLGQNGAPLRLVVPWKYGFKGIKSIVRMAFTEERPPTTWSLAAPREYGFYANVNPEVDHPRWSQATERRIGEWSRRPTLPFNGYADQVGSLYAGMDLRANF